MYILGLVIFVLVSLLLVGVILMQNPKGAGVGSVFGGGSSDVFAPGATTSFFTKLTIVLAGLFIIMALLLSYWARTGAISLGTSTTNVGAVGVASELDSRSNSSILDSLGLGNTNATPSPSPLPSLDNTGNGSEGQ